MTDLLPRPVVTESDVDQRAVVQLGRAAWDGTSPQAIVDRGLESMEPSTKPHSSMDDPSDTPHHGRIGLDGPLTRQECLDRDVEGAPVRKQYHFRPGSGAGFNAWDVDRLIGLVASQPVERLPLDQISELDTDYWFGHGTVPTVRSIAEHFRLMTEVDLQFPIVVDPWGGVMDGMHRVARALAEGEDHVAAKRLAVMPNPDYLDCHPDDLPY